MKALIDKNGCVLNTSHTCFDVHPDFQWIDAPNDVRSGHLYREGRFIFPSPVPVPEKVADDVPETVTVMPMQESGMSLMLESPKDAPTQEKKHQEKTLRLDIHIHIHH